MTEFGEADRDSGSVERGLVSVVVGLVAASLVIISLGPVFQSFYPVPELNPLRAAQQLQQVSDSLRPMSFLLLLGAYALSSLVGGMASTLTSGRGKRWPPVVTGVILMIAGTYGLLVVYQPLWFRAASFLTYPMAYVGYLILRKSTSA